MKKQYGLQGAKAFLWLAPAAIFLIIFFVVPTGQTVWLSLHTRIEVHQSEIETHVCELLNMENGATSRRVRLEEIQNWQQIIPGIRQLYGINLERKQVASLSIGELVELITMRINAKAEEDGTISRFSGLAQYGRLLKDHSMLIALRNNTIWIVMFTGLTIILGMLLAILIEQVNWGRIAKTILFMPMAISYVAASVIWSFMYDKDKAVGTINAIIGGIVYLFSLGSAQYSGIAFLGNQYTVNFALIFAGIWMWVGFCTVIFTAALRSVPNEMLEAASIEGARPIQIFFRITIPTIRSTIIVVSTTMVINVLKIFDIVYAMTDGGPFGESEVIASYMYRTAFINKNFQYAAAMAVILFLAVVPVLVTNIHSFIHEESIR